MAGSWCVYSLTDAHKMAVAGGRKSNLVKVQGQMGEMWLWGGCNIYTPLQNTKCPPFQTS
jgi:hypothetical protein